MSFLDLMPLATRLDFLGWRYDLGWWRPAIWQSKARFPFRLPFWGRP